MRSIPSHIQDMIEEQLITLCTCWYVKLQGGQEYGYTSHDSDLSINGLTYKSSAGLTPTAVSASLGAQPGSADMHAIDDPSAQIIEDFLSGRYDGAEVEVFLVDPNAPEDGRVVLQHGKIADIEIQGSKLRAALKGLLEQLAMTSVVEVSSPACRATLGDGRCKVDLSSYAVSGSITSLDSQTVFYDSNNNHADGWFNQGKVVLQGGEECEINTWSKSEHKFTLFLPPRTTLQQGMSYTAYPGCDRSLATCRDKFSNVANFRGEPYLPGRDKALSHA